MAHGKFVGICFAACSAIALSGCASDIFGETWTEVTTFRSARISLQEAVDKAETTGATATAVSFEASDDIWPDGRYNITLVGNGGTRIVSVNSLSGRLGPKHEEEGIKALLKGEVLNVSLDEQDELGHAALRAGLSLHKAVAAAEQGGGKAMEAKPAMKGVEIGYDVGIVDESGAHKVWVGGQPHNYAAR